ncbi:hypothetical protein NIES4071_100750 (plasmid) [Calothrix sp. NIES-4071]|nr:hypothetical protein NIES4071_100750 [Calothrix sp. NIES-4071]BAZ64456.1 hypothetical protein NIES4105_101890 [Calothrix sp. NIES-4105]
MTSANQASDMKIKLFEAFSDQSRLSILNALKDYIRYGISKHTHKLKDVISIYY